jgi:hypothetical protein
MKSASSELSRASLAARPAGTLDGTVTELLNQVMK